MERRFLLSGGYWLPIAHPQIAIPRPLSSSSRSPYLIYPISPRFFLSPVHSLTKETPFQKD